MQRVTTRSSQQLAACSSLQLAAPDHIPRPPFPKEVKPDERMAAKVGSVLLRVARHVFMEELLGATDGAKDCNSAAGDSAGAHSW